jgi:hypothetical protein
VEQARTQARLLDEHGDLPILLAQLRLHLLERHGSRKPRCPVHDRTPDHRHAALARSLEQLVLASDELHPLLFRVPSSHLRL